MAVPDIVLDVWEKTGLGCREQTSYLGYNTEDTVNAAVFKERWWVSGAGALHTKSERLHSASISSTVYDLLRTNGLAGCMDAIALLYVGDGGTYDEWVNMTFGERCEWIQDYVP